MLQVIKEIARDPSDKTEVSFVFANQTVGDIILKPELDEIAAAHPNIKVQSSPPKESCQRLLQQNVSAAKFLCGCDCSF